MKTVTFDDTKYKLVPVDGAPEIFRAIARQISEIGADESVVWADAVAAAPAVPDAAAVGVDVDWLANIDAERAALSQRRERTDEGM